MFGSIAVYGLYASIGVLLVLGAQFINVKGVAHLSIVIVVSYSMFQSLNIFTSQTASKHE